MSQADIVPSLETKIVDGIIQTVQPMFANFVDRNGFARPVQVRTPYSPEIVSIPSVNIQYKRGLVRYGNGLNQLLESDTTPGEVLYGFYATNSKVQFLIKAASMDERMWISDVLSGLMVAGYSLDLSVTPNVLQPNGFLRALAWSAVVLNGQEPDIDSTVSVTDPRPNQLEYHRLVSFLADVSYSWTQTNSYGVGVIEIQNTAYLPNGVGYLGNIYTTH